MRTGRALTDTHLKGRGLVSGKMLELSHRSLAKRKNKNKRQEGVEEKVKESLSHVHKTLINLKILSSAERTYSAAVVQTCAHSKYVVSVASALEQQNAWQCTNLTTTSVRHQRVLSLIVNLGTDIMTFFRRGGMIHR